MLERKDIESRSANRSGGDIMAHKWMAKVSRGIKRRGTEGVFSAAAHRAGKSTHEFAEEKKHSAGKVGRRARLALAYAAAKH
jgi:hypothetical protein